MPAKILSVIPVLPSADIERDKTWYLDKAGFNTFFSDSMYAVLYRENICMHLQWHADTADDPLPGGSVMRIMVDNIQPFFEEFVQRGTISPNALRTNTAWQTHEFGFYNLNGNAVFLVEYLVR